MHIRELLSTDRRYGIEIEVEGVHNLDGLRRLLPSDLWSIEEDGSLRDGGAELISKPLLPNHIESALYAAYNGLRECGGESTVRTSMHIHVDMTNEHMDRVMTVATAYAMMEPLFFLMAGEQREENIYCVPWYRAPDEARTSSAILRAARDNNTRDVTHMLERDACKYSALYLEPLRRYGTIEFRMFPTYPTYEAAYRAFLLVRRFVDNVLARQNTPEGFMAQWQADVRQTPEGAIKQYLGRDNHRLLTDLYVQDGDERGLYSLLEERDTEYVARLISEPLFSEDAWAAPTLELEVQSQVEEADGIRAVTAPRFDYVVDNRPTPVDPRHIWSDNGTLADADLDDPAFRDSLERLSRIIEEEGEF